MSKKKVKKLLVLGWDAAEWKVIEPMIEQGLMPTLAKFLKEGVSGRIATLDPPFSPMLWTSIATGKRAYDHGILGFIEPSPDNKGIRPVLSSSRKVKAIWNILNQHGYKSNVAGWWPSHPAEPINGIMVSNFFQNSKDRGDKPWPMPVGTVHPEERTKEFAAFRVHPDEITVSLLQQFIPNIHNILDKYMAIDADENSTKEQKERAKAFLNRIMAVSKNIATCTSVHSVGTYMLRETQWDFTAIYLDTIDHFSHIGMKFHPPKLKGVDDEVFETFNNVVTAGYRFHDMLLERVLELIDKDTTVMILSDHGFHPDNLRPMRLPKEPAAPALEHSPYGFFAIKGPGIKKNEKIYGATLLDVTPTILHLYGLPVGKDMEGVVLQQIFEKENIEAVDFIDSWETVAGEDGRHSEESKSNPWADQEAMDQLIELGYVEKPGEDISKDIENCVTEAKYYLARTYINGNKFEDGIKVFEEIVAKYPDRTRYAFRLVNAYLLTKKYKKAKDLIEEIKKQPDVPKYKLNYFECLLYIYTFKIRKALKLLEEVKENSKSATLFLQFGRAFNLRKKWDLAEDNFKKAIEIDPFNQMAHHGLGVSYLRRGKDEEAIDSFLRAIEINNDTPQTHFNLGESLMNLGMYEQAKNAFNMALFFQPKMFRAHFWLAEIFEKQGDKEKAKYHLDLAESMIEGEICIVAGLQRAGTSLMMDILNKKGYNLLFTEDRPADENNPHGYFEYPPANTIVKNSDWLKKANHKIFKMYAQNIVFLPKRFKYKIIWIDRPMDEILSSYKKMKSKPDKAFDTQLASTLSAAVEKAQSWINSMTNAEIIVINYNDLLADSEGEFEDIEAFIGNDFLTKKNVKVS